MTDRINKGLHPRQLARKRRLQKNGTAAPLIKRPPSTYDPTKKTPLFTLPNELLLKILTLVMVTEVIDWPPGTKMAAVARYAEIICPFDEINDHVLTIGLTCHRLHNLLPKALLASRACKVTLPITTHPHAMTSKDYLQNLLNKFNAKLGHPSKKPITAGVCSRQTVDTHTFQQHATHITILLGLADCSESGYDYLRQAAVVLRKCKSLVKVVVQVQRPTNRLRDAEYRRQTVAAVTEMVANAFKFSP